MKTLLNGLFSDGVDLFVLLFGGVFLAGVGALIFYLILGLTR